MRIKCVHQPVVLAVGVTLSAIGVWLLLRPAQYEAVALIQIRPEAGSLADPESITRETTLNAMEQYLSIDRDVKRQSQSIRIHLRDKDPDAAAKIANSVADTYRNDWINRYRAEIQSEIEKLQKRYQVEETNILLGQRELEQLRQQMIIHSDSDSSSGPIPPSDEDIQKLNERFIQEEEVAKKSRSELDELKSIQATNPATLPQVMSNVSNGFGLPELLDRVRSDQQKLAIETNDTAEVSVERAATAASIKSLNDEIDGRVKNLMFVLEVEIDAEASQANDLKQLLKGLQDPNRARIPEVAYWHLKRELDARIAGNKSLKEKIQSMSIDAQRREPDLVTIDRAVPPGVCVVPKRWPGVAFLVCGLALLMKGVASKPQSSDVNFE